MQIDFRLLKQVHLIEIAWNMYKNCKYKCKNIFCFTTTCIRPIVNDTSKTAKVNFINSVI